nr:hypothetical protein [uncultured Draconibacterium sp.]
MQALKENVDIIPNPESLLFNVGLLITHWFIVVLGGGIRAVIKTFGAN